MGSRGRKTEYELLELDILLETIYRISSYDFRQYNRASILRRVYNRMNFDGIATITRVTEKILHEQDFLETLLNDFSISVTEMFRNPPFFYALRREVLPKLRHLSEIRIWHAGCATGEEVFSMAILLKEEGLIEKSIIYATDMNEKTLEKAKRGAFPIKRMQDYTKNYILAGGTDAFAEYYRTDSRYAYFHSSLLEKIIFAQHNLVTDQSFNEFHLILCRNVLIYFTPELQTKVHALLYESLGKEGFLCLGDKETLKFEEVVTHYNEFIEDARIYQKIN